MSCGVGCRSALDGEGVTNVRRAEVYQKCFLPVPNISIMLGKDQSKTGFFIAEDSHARGCRGKLVGKVG